MSEESFPEFAISAMRLVLSRHRDTESAFDAEDACAIVFPAYPRCASLAALPALETLEEGVNHVSISDS